jgi:hypothetical protein
MRPDNTVLHEAHYVPTWVKLSPFVAMLLGFLVASWFYILGVPACRRARGTSGRSTTSC